MVWIYFYCQQDPIFKKVPSGLAHCQYLTKWQTRWHNEVEMSLKLGENSSQKNKALRYKRGTWQKKKEFLGKNKSTEKYGYKSCLSPR